MDGNIDIYCEFGFLEKFCKSCPQTNNSVPNENYKKWFEYFELLCGHSSILLTDIEKKDFITYCDENGNEWQQILYQLLQSRYDGKGNHLECAPKERVYMETYERDGEGIEYFDSKEQHIFFMNRSKNECERMKDDYGLLFISMDNLYEHNLLFTSDIQEINKDSKLWECAKQYRHPCNTIVLVDNYLYKQNRNNVLLKDVIKTNLQSLFDSLLPEKLMQKTFKIYIFTKSIYDERGAEDKSMEKLIQKWIPSLRPYSDKIKIEISTKHETDDHDRYLLTNYGLFNCGYGFVLTDSERRKGTSLSFFPITHSSSGSKKNNVYRIMQNLRKRRNLN